MKRSFSILHIEDDSLWQSAVTAAVRAIPSVSRFDSAGNGQDGLDLANRLRPDLVLLDIGLPDVDGLTLAQDLARLTPPPRILLLSSYGDSRTLRAAMEPHVAGLLWKSGDVLRELPEAVAAVTTGGKVYPPGVRDALRQLRADPKAFYKLLTPRELELIPWFAHGDSDEEVATAFNLSHHTVRAHRHSILQKLDLGSTARLIQWAVRHGFAHLKLPHPREWQRRRVGAE